MPTIKPRGGQVDWPEDEGVIGIVGVAPWATLEFCKTLYAQIRASKDWHYPRVIADINAKIPSRGRHFQLGEEDPSPFIAATIAELHAQGATVIVVPCNTAHVLYQAWAKDAPVPIPHIVEETVDLAAEAGARRVCALTSSSLASFDLYGRMAEERGLQCRRLDAYEQGLVSAMIEEVKQDGRLSEASLVQIDAFVARLRVEEVDACLLGCTELSGVQDRLAHHGLKGFDSNVALARAAIRSLHKG
jgi:aspartate racemase